MVPAWGYVVALLLSAGIAAAFAAYATAHRREPGADWFITLMALQSLWTVLVATGAVLPLEHAAVIQVALLWLGMVVAVAWTGFIVAYTGVAKLTRGRIAGLLAFPAASVPILRRNPGGLAYREFSAYRAHGLSVTELSMGPFGNLMLVFIFVLFFAGVVVLAWYLRFRSVETGQALALLVGSSACIVTGLLVSVGVLSQKPVNPTPFAFPVTALAYGYALFSHELLSVTPATRRIGEQAAIDDLDEGVVILNAADEVVRINPAAAAMFDCAGRDVRGAPFETIAGEAFPPMSELPTTYSTGNRQHLDVSASPVTDDFGRRIGRTLLCRDVTTVEQHRQRLQVLQRLLRHNLRNELNVVEGQTNVLEKRVPEVSASQVAPIRNSARDLLSIAEKMRRIEGLAPGSEPNLVGVDVGEVLERVLETAWNEYPDAELSLSAPEGVRIRTEPEVLEDVVVELVENAIEHGGQTVRIAATDRGDRVEVRIEDDGTGIPEQDRQAVVEGQETALRHTSGVGLWLVKWGTRRLDGSLSFDCEESTGTSVVLGLPAHRSEPDERSTDAAASGDRSSGAPPEKPAN